MVKNGKEEKENKKNRAFSGNAEKRRKLNLKYMKKIHSYMIIAAISLIILIALLSVQGIPKTDKQLEKEIKEECISKEGIFYEGECLTLSEIMTWTNECESQELNPVFLRYDWGGENKCYNETFEDGDFPDSQQEAIVSCGDSGGIPVVTDEVLCVDINASSDSSELEYVEDFSEE